MGAKNVGMTVILISYRHDDATHVRALQTALEGRFGAEAVLRDLKVSSQQGDLMTIVADLVAEATTVLVIIGRDWSRSGDTQEHRRSTDRDWVRVEVSLTLAWNKEIVPVLIEDASMPKRSALPNDLAGIADQVAVRLRDSDWEADLSRLFDRIGEWSPARPTTPRSISISDVGPVAGGNITISGDDVAGRDRHG